MCIRDSYSPERLEGACGRALAISALSYRSVHSILKANLDRQPVLVVEEDPRPPFAHENIRGSEYYQTQEGDTQ